MHSLHEILYPNAHEMDYKNGRVDSDSRKILAKGTGEQRVVYGRKYQASRSLRGQQLRKRDSDNGWDSDLV
jgi:hypothetical protein